MTLLQTAQRLLGKHVAVRIFCVVYEGTLSSIELTTNGTLICVGEKEGIDLGRVTSIRDASVQTQLMSALARQIWPLDPRSKSSYAKRMDACAENSPLGRLVKIIDQLSPETADAVMKELGFERQ